jgi:hypothetical protein
MLTQVRDRIKPLIEQGKSLQEVIVAKPTQPLDDKWGKGALTPDGFETEAKPREQSSLSFSFQ